jgi:hypothetical protein
MKFKKYPWMASLVMNIIKDTFAQINHATAAASAGM